MNAIDVRKRFFSFFRQKGHTEVPSSSLIPQGDDSLLFTNAGMNQFKDFFTGKITPPYQRAVSIQKCVRAGGKHNDLENVGATARHHTYFEMLGNFSFGDYFKKEAIEFAWKFLIEEVGFLEQKFLVTVHHTDAKAFQIWSKHIGIPKSKIHYRGDKDNFWEMGAIGPCGPCSEIFYDYGKNYTSKNFVPDSENLFDDGGRFVEIWNLVFMQYEKTAKGTIDLPNACVDTGMGLERLMAALQGEYFNYETDLFLPIIKCLEKLSGCSYENEQQKMGMRVVADHVRACSMLISDGVVPSNEGRGYVLRRIIRRAIRYLKELKAPPGVFNKLVDPVFNILGSCYPQNKANQPLVEKFLLAEETKFLETLDEGLKFFKKALRDSVESKTLKGEAAFKLYDTYGFPIDLTETILKEKGLFLDLDGFERALAKQREDSKKSWQGGFRPNHQTFFKMVEKHGQTVFVGDDRFQTVATLLEKIEQDGMIMLLFDKTPFYGEGGGQVGDIGTVLNEETNEVMAHITDTKKPIENLYVHYTRDAVSLEVGKRYKLVIDNKRRGLIAKNHSATHLLQKALIQTLGDHVKQAGSLVTDKKLRFDFTHMQGMSEKELKQTEDLVNSVIFRGLSVESETTTMEKALKMGALAFFGEKYGKSVRVLRMGDFSVELCGGTHVQNTASIGLFSIISESSLSSGVRRIEAVTSQYALEWFQRRSSVLQKIEAVVGTKNESTLEKVNDLIGMAKNQKKKMMVQSDRESMTKADELFDDLETVGNSILFKCVQAPDGSDLKKLSDHFISKYKEGVLALYDIKKERTTILLRAKKGLVDCRKILDAIFKDIDGRGGGRADMAQGSIKTSDVHLLKDSIKKQLAAIES